MAKPVTDADASTSPEYDDDTSDEVITGGAVAHNDDAELLAKLDQFDEDAKAKEKAKKPPAKKKDEEDDAAEDEEDLPKPKAKAKGSDEKDGEENDKPVKPKAKEDDAEEEKEPAKKLEPKKDEEEVPSKQLEAILRTKKRAMEDVERARADVRKAHEQAQRVAAESEAKWKPIEEKQKQLDYAIAQVKSSPRAAVQMLKRLGATDWESIANYAIAQGGHPKLDDAFKRQWSIDDGGAGDAVEELRRKTAELDEKLAETKRLAEEAKAEEVDRQQWNTYLDEVVSVVGEDAVLVAAGLKKNAARVRATLRQITTDKIRATKSRPDPKEVAAELERLLREEAEMYGLQVPTRTKSKPNAGENDTASETSRNTARARTEPDDDEDEDEQLRRKLDELDEEERQRKRRLRK